MTETKKARHVGRWLLSLALLLMSLWGGVYAKQHQWLDRGWFNLLFWWESLPQGIAGVWLNDYQVVLDAVELPDVHGLSDVQYDPERQALWVLVDHPAELLLVSLQGQVLARTRLLGLEDAEALTLVAPGRLVVADERVQRLLDVQLENLQASLTVDNLPNLTLGVARNGNKGFEGLAWDSSTEQLSVAKERDPKQLFTVKGFPYSGQENLVVDDDAERNRRLFMRDISGLHFDGQSGHLLVLSDESQLLLEVDRAGRPKSSLSLRRGAAGLKAAVPQAEGVSMDEAGNLYLVSEPNLLYVFARRKTPAG